MSPSSVTLKSPKGVGAPGFWAASGSSAGVRIWDPAPSITAAGSGLAPLPALPAAKMVPLAAVLGVEHRGSAVVAAEGVGLGEPELAGGIHLGHGAVGRAAESAMVGSISPGVLALEASIVARRRHVADEGVVATVRRLVDGELGLG